MTFHQFHFISRQPVKMIVSTKLHQLVNLELSQINGN